MTTEPDLIGTAEIARRVVEQGYAETMSRQRVLQLLRDDPDFPPPLPTSGRSKLWSWSGQIEPYFKARDPRPGRPPAARPPKPTPAQP